MFREFIIGIRIGFAIVKDLKIECRLMKHRCKMVDSYKKYRNVDFKIPIVKSFYEDLYKRIIQNI